MSAKPIKVTVFAALVAGALAVIVALFGFGGPSPTFAQTDTTAPTISSIAITSDPDENDSDLGAYSTGRSGGSIIDAADNDANLSHNALADQDGHKVDGIRPRKGRRQASA